MNSSKKIAAVAIGAALTLGLTACSEPASPGSEAAPIYSGEIFDSRTIIGFASGEEMDCYELDTGSTSSDVLFCDWGSAPKANLKLAQEFREDWTLVFAENKGGITVCLAKGWDSPEKISCALNHVVR